MDNETNITENSPNKRLENLAPPFQPGQSGNPKGKPKGILNMTTLLKKLLKEKVEVEVGGVKIKMTKRKAMMLKWLDLGMHGKLRAIEKIVERVEGKASQPIEMSGNITATGIRELQDLANSMKENVTKTDGESEGSGQDSSQ